MEKGIRLARKNTTPLAPLVRRPWNPLEDEPQDYEELRPAPPEPAHTVSRELEPLATVFTPCCSSVASEVEVLEPEVEAVDCNGGMSWVAVREGHLKLKYSSIYYLYLFIYIVVKNLLYYKWYIVVVCW